MEAFAKKGDARKLVVRVGDGDPAGVIDSLEGRGTKLESCDILYDTGDDSNHGGWAIFPPTDASDPPRPLLNFTLKASKPTAFPFFIPTSLLRSFRNLETLNLRMGVIYLFDDLGTSFLNLQNLYVASSDFHISSDDIEAATISFPKLLNLKIQANNVYIRV